MNNKYKTFSAFQIKALFALKFQLYVCLETCCKA